MKAVGDLLVLSALVFLASANADLAAAQNAAVSQRSAQVEAAGRSHRPLDAPQALVVCTGWHALCSASTDCRVNGETADCDCLRVDETHIVETSEIQDLAVKRLTLARCTGKHPCDVDEAPVCRAIGRARLRG